MKLAAIIFILFTSSLTFAAETEDIQIVDPTEAKVVLKNSSEHNRIGKNFEINWQFLSGSTSGASERGLGLGYHLDRSSLIQLELYTGAGHDIYNWDSNSYGSAYTDSINLNYKRFLGNSFYVKTGLEYRNLKYDFVSYDYYPYAYSVMDPTNSYAINKLNDKERTLLRDPQLHALHLYAGFAC